MAKTRYGDVTFDKATSNAMRVGELQAYSDSKLAEHSKWLKDNKYKDDKNVREEAKRVKAEQERRSKGGKIKEYDSDKYLDKGQKNLRSDSFWSGFNRAIKIFKIKQKYKQ